MIKWVYTALSVCFCSQLTFSQSENYKQIDKYLDDLEKHNKFMGSVAVAKNGAIVYSKAVGYSDVEKGIRANEDSKYRIGSISKTFTAVLVMQAVEQGKLKLDTRLNTFFPTIKNADKITISHLLNHRSGIHSFTDDDSYLEWNTQAKTEKEMLAIIEKGNSLFAPDSKAQYSNSNYVLLSYILEKVYKESFGSILQKNIAKPIGLKNTYLAKTIDVYDNEVKSYTYTGNWKLESETDPSIPLGAGAIVSNPQDIILFSNALFEGKLLQPSSLEYMKTLKDNYGSGLFKYPFNGKFGYGHTGGIDGFSSIFTYFENDKITYVMTSNGANTNTNTISLVVLSEAFGVPYQLPEITTYKVDPKDLDAYLGVYSSTQLPIKITITRVGETLMAQATGQSSFPLEAVKKDVFQFEVAGIVIEFNSNENNLILIQGGGNFTFSKE